MSKHFCPNCEDGSQVVEKKISIPVGSESFSTHTLVCKKCGYYALTPKIRKEMDEWGRSLKRNIIEPQPILSEAAHQFAEQMAGQYGMKRVPFIRALTVFYLNHIVGREDFPELKKICETDSSTKLLAEGDRSKVSVPVNYLMYRKLQTFSEVWNVSHAKAIEEATLFGLVVLSRKKENQDKLRLIAESLLQYISDVAQAA